VIVLVVSKVSPSLRGRLTRWLLQLKPGVFVGTLTHRVRSRLWESTCGSLRGGWAVLLYSAKTEQGFDVQTHGASPIAFEDFDGLWMAKKQNLR